jgi:tRNA threonylcarbamoyladenosine biosynthesis protein TsaB
MGVVLGLDTATPDAAVAVTRNGEPLLERSTPPGPAGQPRHAAALLPEVEAAVEAAGGWDTVDRIAVGVGPGSFTGIRIGVATARALAQSLDKEIAPVSTPRALAAGIARLGLDRSVLAVIDARREEAFAALYEPGGTERWEPRVMGPEELVARVSALAEAPLAGGDGALRFRRELEDAGAEVPPDGAPEHRLAAKHVCRLGEDSAPVRLHEVRPVYLRQPDAKRWRERDRQHR